MRFLVITNAPTFRTENGLEAYAPYVKEMNIWFKYAEEIAIASPITYPYEVLTEPFDKQDITLFNLSYIEATSPLKATRAVIDSVRNMVILTRACRWADHIHLRCPGNIGLLGCLVQIFFPNKVKTAKYAGNWDPNSKQPISYRLQRRILRSTFLTKNINVLVYGKWDNQNKNILPFFTATYKQEEKEVVRGRSFNAPFNFMFVGALAEGKRPLLACQVVKALLDKGLQARLNIYGDGPERASIEDYIKQHSLKGHIILHGNQDHGIVKKAYRETHFLFLMSKSEGWPKAVAESMFWGAIPIASPVSCVPYMLGDGERGIISYDLQETVDGVLSLVQEEEKCLEMSDAAMQWSRNYTLEAFEEEIKKLL